MASAGVHELQSIGSGQSTGGSDFIGAGMELASSDNEVGVHQLPPTDHGKQAYLVLAGCTFIQAPVWGEQTFRSSASSH
jgi:hypothetical protein